MATSKNEKSDSKAAPKSAKMKELSKADQKKTKGGRASGVFGGLAGPESFTQP